MSSKTAFRRVILSPIDGAVVQIYLEGEWGPRAIDSLMELLRLQRKALSRRGSKGRRAVAVHDPLWDAASRVIDLWHMEAKLEDMAPAMAVLQTALAASQS